MGSDPETGSFRALTRFTLVVETSGTPASIAIAPDGRAPVMLQIGGARPDLGRELLPAIDRACKESGVAPRDLARVVAGLGPGSYTGLRIGLAAARSLAFAANAQIAGYPSTLAAAAAIFANPIYANAARAAVALDALRGEFAFALYTRDTREPHLASAPPTPHPGDAPAPVSATAIPRQLLAPSIINVATLRSLLLPGDILVSDAPAAAAAATDGLYTIAPSTPNALILLALDAAGAPPHSEIVPLYLRASAAEENAARMKIENNK